MDRIEAVHMARPPPSPLSDVKPDPPKRAPFPVWVIVGPIALALVAIALVVRAW